MTLTIRTALWLLLTGLGCSSPSPDARPISRRVPDSIGRPQPAITARADTLQADTVTRIRLKTGRIIELVSNPHAEERSRQYAYDGHLSHAPFHGVFAAYYEATEYLLFHDSTGRRTRLDARPVVSPSGRYLAVASLDLNFIVAANALTIVRVEGDSVVTEWRTAPRDWGPQDPSWVGDDTLQLVQLWATAKPGVHRRTPAQLVRRDRTWELQGGKP